MDTSVYTLCPHTPCSTPSLWLFLLTFPLFFVCLPLASGQDPEKTLNPDNALPFRLHSPGGVVTAADEVDGGGCMFLRGGEKTQLWPLLPLLRPSTPEVGGE